MTDTLRVSQTVVEAFVSNIAIAALGTLTVSQVVVEAFVSDNALPTQTPAGPNSGTPICHPYRVHLDRKCRLQGVHGGGTPGTTTWTLPVADSTLIGIVLADSAFTTTNGTYLTGTYSAGSVSVAGDYSAGYAILGRPYTMSVELSRPYRRPQSITGTANAVISDRLQLLVMYADHRNTGDYTIRASMAAPPTRSDRTKTFAYATVGSVEEQGETRALLSGWAEKTRLFLESALPRPCTITAIKYTVEVGEDDG